MSGHWAPNHLLRRFRQGAMRAAAALLWRHRAGALAGQGLSDPRPRPRWRRCCWSAPSPNRSPRAPPSSPGPGSTPGRRRASRCRRGSAQRHRARRRQLARRSPSAPATSTARRMPASPARRSMRRIATRIFAFLGEVPVGDEIAITRRDGRAFRYGVTGTAVVRWDRSGIDPLGLGKSVVPSTCWPL